MITLHHPFVLVKRETISLSWRSDFDINLSAVLPSSSMACGSAPLQKREKIIMIKNRIMVLTASSRCAVT